ncbi:MAG: hypothetical protein WBD20_18500 [Pirellulaceae bacterium]
MPPTRQTTTTRRRRVLYSAQNADAQPATAANRRAKEKLREARQPAKAYGAKVNRRLRGRWFSLVPVTRSTLTIVASCIALSALLLTYAHYAAVTWPSLVYHPDIARPLRLDRPDSFGRWFTCVMLAASSGASLLIYQLRRHRNDDYAGHYRLWRIVIVVLLLTSINSLISVVSWSGSLLDALVGKRVAFSGYDWLRIFLGVGGVVLALRLAAELRRSRWALSFVAIACVMLALPEAAKWQLFQVETINRWALITAAPLLGYTALFLALGGYLRLLYREVRGIVDTETFAQRVGNLRRRVLPMGSGDDSWSSAEKQDDEQTEEPEDDEHEVAADDPKKKRRWFGLRAAKPDAPEASDDEDASEEPAPRAKKKRRFGLRLDPKELDSDDASDDEPAAEESSDEDDDQPAKPKRRFGLSWRKKSKPTEASDDDDDPSDDSDDESEQHSHAATGSSDTRSNDDYIDPDEIDWDSLSKAERRRLRKKIKRQDRAA